MSRPKGIFCEIHKIEKSVSDYIPRYGKPHKRRYCPLCLSARKHGNQYTVKKADPVKPTISRAEAAKESEKKWDEVFAKLVKPGYYDGMVLRPRMSPITGLS